MISKMLALLFAVSLPFAAVKADSSDYQKMLPSEAVVEKGCRLVKDCNKPVPDCHKENNKENKNDACIGPSGPKGQKGDRGPRGRRGAAGHSGAHGRGGDEGEMGPTGPTGHGLIGPTGPTGAPGVPGAPGPTGPTGFTGPTGPTGTDGIGGLQSFSDFFALMPPDNAATVAPGAPVLFPQDGPTNGVITRVGPGTFLLPNVGTYMVQFQVSVTEAGQLIIALDNVDVPSSVVGRATGTSQIVGISLITTTAPNTLLEIRNPAGESTALTITPLAGGTRPVSAHLVITQIE